MNKNKKLVKAATIGLAALIAAPMILTPAMTVKAAEKKSTDQIVAEIMAGKWGNGADRKARLKAAGYDYSAIQTAVNGKDTSTAKATAASVKKSQIDNSTKTALGTLFDATAYAKMYPDVVKVYGNNPDKLFNHFITYGIYELRQPSYTFNVNAYASSYDDLEKAFGNDVVAYYKHYVTFGSSESENRTLTTISTASLAGKTVYSISGMTKGSTFSENAAKAASEGTVMTVISTPVADTVSAEDTATESDDNGNAFAQRYAMWLVNEPQRATYLANTTYEADYTAWENKEPVRSNYVVSRYATQEAATEAYETAHNTWEAATPKVETYLAGTSYSADLAAWNTSKPKLSDFGLMEATVDGNKMILHSTAADISEAYGQRVKDGYIEIDGAYHKIAIASDALTTTINEGYISLNGSYYKTATEAEATERVLNDGYIKIDGAYYYVMPESEATYYTTNAGYYIYNGNYVKECTEAEAAELKLKDDYIKVGDRYYVTVGKEEATTTTLDSGYYCDGSSYYLIEDESEHMVVTTKEGYVKDAEGYYHVIRSADDALETVVKDGYIEIDETINGVVSAQKYFAIVSAEEAYDTQLKAGYIKIGESYYQEAEDEEGVAWTVKDFYALAENGTFIYTQDWKNNEDDARKAYGNCNYYEKTDDCGITRYYKIVDKMEATVPAANYAYDETSGKYYSTTTIYREEDVTNTVWHEGYTSYQKDGVSVYYKNEPVAASVATETVVKFSCDKITVDGQTIYYDLDTVDEDGATTSSLAENYVEITVNGTAKCYNKTATVDADTATVTVTNSGYAYDEASGSYYATKAATESDATETGVKSGYMYDEDNDCYCKSVDRSEAAQFNILDNCAVTEDGTYYCIYGEPVQYTEALENATLHNTEYETIKEGYIKIGYNYYKTVTEATATTATGELNEGYAKEGDTYYATTAVDESTATTTALKDGYAATENGYRETAECDSDDALEAYLKDGYVSYDNCTYKVAGDGDTSIGSYNAELENWNNSEPNQATYLAGTSYASDLGDYLASEPIKDNYKVGYATEEAATEAFNADEADWEESKPSEDTYIDSTSYQSDHDIWKSLEPTE